MKNKLLIFNKIYVGLLLGLALPVLTFYVYFLIRHHQEISFEFFISMLHKYRLLFKVVSLCVLVNLPVFYGFIQLKFWQTSKGIVMACFLFAFAVAGYQLFT
ncbi:MAG TPA: hypothetical protein PKJ43_05285 [Prolixibacteraceae bacterium]|jgi:hypothetical protein|nr:hypothetical protein [Prolixibacteraceae bacterium]